MSYRLQNIRLDTGAMNLMLNAPTGPVGRHLLSMGNRIAVMARQLTGVQSGRLSRSIRVGQARAPGGQLVRVYSNSKYAYYVHEGTRARVIDPPGARVMTFNAGGRRVYAQQVRHPGTRGKYFLTIPLRRVVR